MENSEWTAIDIFCGGGGVSEGLSTAGFEVQWALDRSRQASRTYNANHELEPMIADIRQISIPDLDAVDELDLFAGALPCAPSALLGPAGGEQSDERFYDLYESVLRVLEAHQPKALMMQFTEKPIESRDDINSSLIEQIVESLEDLGFDVTTEFVNALNFGVPQSRPRLFFIATRLNNELSSLTDWETHQEPADEGVQTRVILRTLEEIDDGSKIEDGADPLRETSAWNTVADALFDLPLARQEPSKSVEYGIDPLTNYQQWIRGSTEEVHNHTRKEHCEGERLFYRLIDEGVNWIDSEGIEPATFVEEPMKTITKPATNRPAPTVCSCYAHDEHHLIHPREPRHLTVREMARLQSFKDSYRFPVKRSDALRQIGRAVPPRLVEAIATAIQSTVLDGT